MRLVIARLPALDAALIRFDAWWSGLSPRERVLLGVLGGLLALALLVYGVVKPLQAARAEAIADIRTYETLSARVRAAGTLVTTPVARRQGAPADVAIASAAAVGLTVTPQATPEGVRVTLTDVAYDTLLAWIADLSATSDLRVRHLSVRRGPAAGRVAATVDLAS